MNKMSVSQRKNIVEKPGCYIYYNIKKEVIYIGKAKNLLKRVNSYFDRFQSVKTDELVKNIVYFDYIITNTEKESLLLEINLIQKHKPKYNILLKDGRNYPYIRISDDKHPKIDFVLNRLDDKIPGKYYGPFPDASTAKKLSNIINEIFLFRKCRIIPKNKCIYYDMKLCHAPCINMLPDNIYDEDINMINDFFNSKPKKLIKFLSNKMINYSNNNDFEEAMKIRDTLKYINEFISEQIVEVGNTMDFDVISIDQSSSLTGMYTLSVRGGLLLAHDFISGSDTKINDAITNRYYNNDTNVYIDNLKFYKKYKDIFTRFKISNNSYKLELSKLANDNLKIQMEKQVLEKEKIIRVNKFFDEVLNIKKKDNIFLLDISHISGEHNVGGLVCYSNNIKNKKMYRKYNVSFNSNNDTASIREVVNRIISNTTIIKNMDIFIIDGGINQRNVVNKIFETNNINIPVIALEKNDKHITNTIIYKKEIELNDPVILSYFGRMQEEVHRFANSYMYQKNMNQKIKSIFDDISGVGPKRRLILERNFKSLEEISSTSIEDLIELGFSEKLALSILVHVNEMI